MESFRVLAEEMIGFGNSSIDSDISFFASVDEEPERVTSDFGRFICKKLNTRRTKMFSHTNVYKSWSTTTNFSTRTSIVPYDSNDEDVAITITPVEPFSALFRSPITTMTQTEVNERIRDQMSYIKSALQKKKRRLQYFYNGASYLGEWNSLGFSGHGIYKYPHGVIYEGHFNSNGEFDGLGTLIYPSGKRIDGIWQKGKLTTRASYRQHAEEAECQDDTLPDRRFPREKYVRLQAPGLELLTDEQPTRELGSGSFDVGDGTFNFYRQYIVHTPKMACKRRLQFNVPLGEDNKRFNKLNDIVMDEETLKFLDSLQLKNEDQFILEEKLARSSIKKMKVGYVDEHEKKVQEIPTSKKVDWIKTYCRSYKDEPVGYNPHLYEVFTSGAKEEIQKIKGQHLEDYWNYAPDLTAPLRTQHVSTPMMFATRINKIRTTRIYRKFLPLNEFLV